MAEKPHFVLATTPACPHCPAIKKLARDFEQQQLLASLEIIDITQHPEFAAQHNIRSVPWFRIGDLEFSGSHSGAEIKRWIELALTHKGIRQYLVEQLEAGQLGRVEQLILQHPDWLTIVLPVLADPMSPIQARVGLSALIEGLQDQALLRSLLPGLTEYARHEDQRVRADACHLLGYIKDDAAHQVLEECQHDSDADVREIARDSLAQLRQDLT